MRLISAVPSALFPLLPRLPRLPLLRLPQIQRNCCHRTMCVCVHVYIRVCVRIVSYFIFQSQKALSKRRQQRQKLLPAQTKPVFAGGEWGGARKESIEVIVTSVALRFGRGSAANGVYLVAAT